MGGMQDLPAKIVLACAAMAALLLLACERAPPRHAPLPADAVVLAIGDSVTYGTGAAAGEDYPSQLAAMTGWSIQNHGVPGDTSADVRARIDAALDETRPALVILEIGGNDFLRRQPEAATRENIRVTLRRIRQAGVPAVLVTVPQFSPLGAVVGRLPDAPLYAELAKEEDVPLIPAVFARVLADPDLRADPVHPNAAGYRKLAEGIAAELARFGFLGDK